MTVYVGEALLLTHTATYEGVALTSSGYSAFIDIYDSASTHLVGSSMSWNATDERWEYQWSTATHQSTLNDGAGKYTCKVWIYGGPVVNWEYFNVTLKADKIPGGGD